MLTPFAPAVYVHDGAKRFCGFRLQRCMTILVLEDGKLWVHSPNRLDAALRTEVDRLGEVAFVVAPNSMHTHAVAEWKASYPAAAVWVAPDMARRHPRLRFDERLGAAPPPAWAGELDQAIVEGNVFFREVVFLHRASRTLIVTDLIENLGRAHLAPCGRAMAALFGIYGHVAPAPEHAWYAIDGDALASSLARIAAWDFDRIILAHGTRIERDGKQEFERVAARLVDKARRRGPLRRGLARVLAWCE